MRPSDDPSYLTPSERLIEIASILAAGILRLNARSALTASVGKPSNLGESSEFLNPCLEVPPETVLTVHTG